MNVKVLFIGGVFAKENISEIEEQAIGTIEYSANTFQERLITGFYKNKIDISVVSAPFIGAYPMRSRQMIFKGFKNTQKQYEYVPFINVWGIRNFSRAHSIKHKIRDFAYEKTECRKMIVVYSAHEPFLEAAAWAKKIDPTIRICFVVPDLPQYMNLDSNKSIVYDILKRIDIARMEKYMESVDSFVLLTEQMKDMLQTKERSVLVVEGMVDCSLMIENVVKKETKETKYIVYTGKLNRKFGIKNLIDEFVQTDSSDYRLVLCGAGDCAPYINKKMSEDNRIIYLGQVTPEEARIWQQKADVLVNPRMNNEEYTKYSFPSKTIEYLLTGNPVAAYLLDGMKEIYKDFLYVIPEKKDSGIMETVREILEDDEMIKRDKYEKFSAYAKKNLNAEHIVKEIMNLCN